MRRPEPSGGALSALVVRLATLWVLAGAGYKLFSGSPNDLPPVVREFFLGPDLTFKLAIAVELAIAFTALWSPRLGWPLLTLLFTVFLGILVQLIASGETSCGCFGSKVEISPVTMFSIDGACLLAVLATRPWRKLRGGGRKASPLVPILAAGVSFAAPFLYIESAPSELEARVDEETGEWHPPEKEVRYAQLDPKKWVGKHIRDTQLAAWMNVDEHVTDGTWILYRVGCDHCARYLRHLHDTFDPADPKFYTYVRLSEEGEEEIRQVDPAHLAYGMEAILPETSWVITPPWRLELESGIVKEAVFEGDFEERLDAGAPQ